MNNQPPDFPIAGIGASAGGVRALQEFFDHLPDNSGMAYIVVIHLDPKKSSNLNKLIGSYTGMPVKQVSRKTRIRPDNVYVISPGKILNVQDGYLVTEKKVKEEHATIDTFFRSLAAQSKERAISVILSGTGSDGTAGLKAIKEQGGVVMAQDPKEAEYDGMLLNAIQTTLVDFVLPLKEMAPKLLEYKNALSRVSGKMLKGPEKLPEKESEALTAIFTRLHSKTSHDFLIISAHPYCGVFSAVCR